ncbi:TIGR02452 family protein [Longispora sp. K20-0274]|uniref:TIGR02452 family protein n=1 Tax=Longispora sp. K20-0274 TaxID=3088255 RepID=UPI00399B46D0
MSSRLRAIAKETVAIVERGGYDVSGRFIALDIAAPVGGTRLHLPEEPLATPERGAAPVIEVTGETTLAALERITGDVAALCFASAKNPGGGFLNGAQAQEESLARGSALYACLTAVPEFYAFHRAQRDLLYSDRVIHSPGVPVFRDDRGGLLPAPRTVHFLTAAAPNAAMIARNEPASIPEIAGTLRRRAGRVLDVAGAHGHRRLVLGAWGCGVFGNDPALVAEVFAAALAERPWFDHVTFAVYDRQAGAPTRAAFDRAFS